MKRKYRIVNGRKFHIHEHLEFAVKHTTYSDRLQWLEEAQEFARLIPRKKIILSNTPGKSR